MEYKSGEIADISGQYGINDPVEGLTELEVTVVKGEPFPPTKEPGQTFILVDETKHKNDL